MTEKSTLILSTTVSQNHWHVPGRHLGSNNLENTYENYIIAHEIGHYITNFFNSDQSPGGRHDNPVYEYDWTLAMNEALSHLFAYNVVTNLSRSQPDFTWTFINNHIHNLDAHDPNKQEEITGPFREYAIARTMWRIQKNVFNRDFDKIIKIWRSLKEVDLVHVYSWQKKAQEHVSNMSIHIQEEMERGGMFNDRGSQKIHFNYRVNTLVADVPYRAYGLVSADSGRPIWRNNSVIYYNVNQTTKKRLTRMSINCEPNTRYKIDFIGANGFIQKTDAIRGSKNNIALPSNRVSYTIRIRIERIRPQFIPDPEEIQMTATFK